MVFNVKFFIYSLTPFGLSTIIYFGCVLETVSSTYLQCYKTSAEQLISASLLAENDMEKPDLESLRDSAIRIFNQYLSEKVNLLYSYGAFNSFQSS